MRLHRGDRWWTVTDHEEIRNILLAILGELKVANAIAIAQIGTTELGPVDLSGLFDVVTDIRQEHKR